jgi:hypothetical protein
MQTDHTTKLAQLNGCISTDTLEELVSRALLHFSDDHWRFGDDNNGTRRRLDGKPWRVNGEQVKALADTKGAEWHQLIGLDDVVTNDRPYALLTIEGSKDALAAADLAFRIGALSETGIMCALGSGYRSIPSELHKLAGRWVGVIGDNNEEGIKTAQLVSFALNTAGVDHMVWDWSKCETKAGDFFEFWADCILKEVKSFKSPFVRLLKGTFLSPSSPSECSRVQEFKSSSPETRQIVASITDDEKLGIVSPYIVIKKGSGNSMSFQLARKIKVMKLDMKDIDEIHGLWFAESRPHLPPDADEAKSLQTFYRQLKRVRFTDSALKAACERARKAKPPFLPAHDGNEELAKLAALHRELQRDARDRPYICPIGVVVEFIPVRWRSQAAWLTHVLEEEGVIKCVDRGTPNKVGVKGKPTCWRYVLPLDQ